MPKGRPMTAEELDVLETFATTDHQRKLIAAIRRTGSNQQAAKELGRNRTTVDKQMRVLKWRAAKQGYSPEHGWNHLVPDGQKIRGVSSLVDSQGNVLMQWVKSAEDRERQLELYQEMVQAVIEGFPGRAKPVKAPAKTSAHLISVIPMGDPHLGMYAWAEESGDDFDIEIAQRQLKRAIERLVASGPRSGLLYLLNLGDFFHADTKENRTLRSGHALDVDTRWGKVLGVGVQTMRHCIDMALRHHDAVKVINVAGNHDEHTSLSLSLILDAYYSDEPRVEVDKSVCPFRYIRFGKNLIGTTHGDMVKPEALPGIMATDRPEDWGAATHRYWYTGHVHHRRVFEFPGVTAESFRTLAARDAWHNASGYRAGRDMSLIVLEREGGEVERHVVDIRKLK